MSSIKNNASRTALPGSSRFELDLFRTAYFEDGSLRAYEQARRTQQWRVDDLPWNSSSSTLDDEQMERGWRLASHSMYAEQAGLLVTAMLVEECPFLPTRLALSTAVSDEAKHVEVFTRYAQRRGGIPPGPSDHITELTGYLGSLSNQFERFFIHTLLEGWALDEFVLLERLFTGDVLADVYRHVRTDEARHVAIGMSYLTRAVRDYRACRDPAEVRQALTDVEVVAARLSGIVPASFEAFGRLLGRDPIDVRHWFQDRHRRRVLPLFESQWMDDRSFTGGGPEGGR